MSQKNLQVVRGIYEAFARRDVPALVAALDPKVEWRLADNWIYADRDPLIVPQAAIVEGQITRLVAEWVRAQFSHIWTLAGGKVRKFQQYADTKQFAEAVTGGIG
jgi:uncharacterized protein